MIPHPEVPVKPACVWLVLCSMSLRAQSTWYVDVAATPPGSGTLAAPFASIQFAHDQTATVHGDTLLVAPGVYVENLNLSKGVLVQASAGPLATQIRQALAGQPTVRLESPIEFTPHVTLVGFTIRNVSMSYPSYAVRSISGELRECIVVGSGFGIGARSEYDLWLFDCLITGFQYGQTVNPFTGLAFGSNNIISGNSIADVQDSWTSLFEYSCISDGSGGSGTGNFAGDPQVFDLAGHDLHLRPGSACIDAGHPASPLDPDGSRADVGPLAFDPAWTPFEIYCTAKINSLGCVPAISAVGTPSYSSTGSFWIHCTQELNQRPGLLFYGFAPKNQPFQGGYLCVQAPVRRTEKLLSGGHPDPEDCSGAYAVDFNARIRLGIDPMLTPSREVFAQFWSRDPAASFSTNRSDALRFVIQP